MQKIEKNDEGESVRTEDDWEEASGYAAEFDARMARQEYDEAHGWQEATWAF